MLPSLLSRSALIVVILSASACSQRVAKLAEGKGPLATDAKAVLLALEKSGVPMQEVTVWEDDYKAPSSCQEGQAPCAGVIVNNERITELIGYRLRGIDLRPLVKATALRDLELRGGTFTTLDHLEAVPNLTRLRIQESALRALPGLSKLERLSGLHLEKNQLTILEGVSGHQELMTLDASNNQLERVERLEKLPKLTTVDLRGNKLQRFAGARGLPALREIALEKNPLETIEGLEDLPELGMLRFDPKPLKHLRGLSNVGLRHLDLTKSELLSLEGVRGLKVLRELALPATLRELELRDLPALPKLTIGKPGEKRALETVKIASLPTLEQLDLASTPLRTLELSDLPKLANLDLSATGLTAVPHLHSAPPKPDRLDLSHNAITSLAGIARLDPKVLRVSHNKLTSLAPSRAQRQAEATAPGRGVDKAAGVAATTAGPMRLELLYADSNQLKSLAGYQAYPKLKLLSVDNNQIASLAAIDTCGLTDLYVAHNKLESLAGVQKCKLEILNVSHNALTRLAPLKLAYPLRKLFANNNKLSDAKAVFGDNNKRPSGLEHYDLRGNAFAAATPAWLLFYLYKPPSPVASSARSAYGGSRKSSSGPRSGRIRSVGGRYSSGSGGYRYGK